MRQQQLGILLGLLLSITVHGAEHVQAVGLMSGMAILEVDGQRITMRAGQKKLGIHLIKVDSREALIELNGRRLTLELGLSVTGDYSEPQKTVVRLPRGDGGHYFANARFNGKSIKVLVDTGATSVAMSSETAKRLGINYANGKKGRSSTANGIVRNYIFKLNTLTIGGIKRYGVTASVIEGRFPSMPLLGMSFLNSVKMKEEMGMLVLTD